MNMNCLNKYIASILVWWMVGFFGNDVLYAADVFTQCTVSRQKLEWGEPCVITLSVYTRTWFTEGVTFPEMEKQQGVLLKKGRSYTIQEEIKGERFSVVKQEYWYYPLQQGNHTIRFNGISVSVPPVGGYKGVERHVDFPAAVLTVMSAFPGQWDYTVASRLNMIQKWTLPETLKQGDVIAREVTCKAWGVPAAFIVPVSLPDTSGAFHVISERPSYSTRIEEKNVKGEAVQRFLYQLKDTGRVVIPDFKVRYWNRIQHRMDSVSLEGKIVCVDASEEVLQDGESAEETARKERKEVQWTVILWYMGGGCLLGGVLLRVYRCRKCRLLGHILVCTSPYRLYDLLYLYVHIFFSCDSFEQWILMYRNSLKEWYPVFLENLFSGSSKRGVGFVKRCYIVWILARCKSK